MPDPLPFTAREFVSLGCLGPNGPVSWLENPSLAREKRWLNYQNASDFIEQSRFAITDAHADLPNTVAHFIQACTTVADSKTIPGQPIGQGRVSREEAEATDSAMGGTKLEKERRKWVRLKCPSRGRGPEVDLINVLLAKKELIPAEVSDGDRT